MMIRLQKFLLRMAIAMLVVMILPTLAMARSPKVYRHMDHRGNVKFLTNEVGEITTIYKYHAYGLQGINGNTQRDTRTFAQGRQLGSGMDDLVLVGARVYDPSSGRFISKDSVYHLYNQYSYTDGNPIDMWDPSGLSTGTGGSGGGGGSGAGAGASAGGFGNVSGASVNWGRIYAMEGFGSPAGASGAVSGGLAGLAGLSGLSGLGGLGAFGGLAGVSGLGGLSFAMDLNVGVQYADLGTSGVPIPGLPDNVTVGSLPPVIPPGTTDTHGPEAEADGVRGGVTITFSATGGDLLDKILAFFGIGGK